MKMDKLDAIKEKMIEKMIEDIKKEFEKNKEDLMKYVEENKGKETEKKYRGLEFNLGDWLADYGLDTREEMEKYTKKYMIRRILK